MSVVPVEASSGHQIPWSWRYKSVSHLMWGTGNRMWSSGRTALNHKCFKTPCHFSSPYRKRMESNIACVVLRQGLTAVHPAAPSTAGIATGQAGMRLGALGLLIKITVPSRCDRVRAQLSFAFWDSPFIA